MEPRNHTKLPQNLARLLLVSVLALSLSLVTSCEQGEVIEDIGNHSVTTAEFEEHYNTSVEIATRISNAEKDTLYKLICNPSLAPNAQYQDMAIQLQPRQNYQQFRDSRIVEIVAEEEGFLNRPIVQQILEHTKRTTIAQLYLHEKVWERIKISEEDKQNACQELRQKDPARVGPLPLDDCLKVAEGMLKSQKYRREVPEEGVQGLPLEDRQPHTHQHARRRTHGHGAAAAWARPGIPSPYTNTCVLQSCL